MPKKKSIETIIEENIAWRGQGRAIQLELEGRTGFTDARCAILWAIGKWPNSMQSELHHITNINKPSLSIYLKELAKDGLVIKHPREDGRIGMVLTTTGKATLDKILKS